MGHSQTGAWTIERVDLFNLIHESAPKAIWEAVNALPGPAITRSAVIGRRDRKRGMSRRPIKTLEEITASLLARRERENIKRRAKRAGSSAPINFNRVEAAKERAANGGDPVPYICIDAADITPRHLPLAELQNGECRYPYGDGPFRFCGNQIFGEGSYCPGHHRLCSAGVPTRKNVHPTAFGQSKGGVFGRVA